MEKSVVLIDAENVIKSWRNYCDDNSLTEKIDYKKLAAILSKNTNLLRAYFYDGVPETIPLKKKNFLEALEKKGIQLRTKILKNRQNRCKACGDTSFRTVQKGVDVSLATDILRHAFQKTCEICIVVSGDEDYCDAIEAAKNLGIKVWVASFKGSLSSKVERSADKIVLIEDIFENVKRDI